MTTTCTLWLLTVCTIGYAFWTVWYLFRESWRSNRRPPVSADTTVRKEIIGKSCFVLDRRRSQPQATIAAGTEKGIEKEDIFAPASVPEHPRQIPPEDLDEIFDEVPVSAAQAAENAVFVQNAAFEDCSDIRTYGGDEYAEQIGDLFCVSQTPFALGRIATCPFSIVMSCVVIISCFYRLLAFSGSS